MVVPKGNWSPQKIKMSIDLKKPKKGFFKYGYCVQKTECQIACHLGLHNKPHGVYGLYGKNKMVDALGLRRNQIVMMPSYKDHLYDNSSPDKPVVINVGDHIWNYGPSGYFDEALLAQGFRSTVKHTMTEFLHNSDLMSEWVQKSRHDKRGLCAMQLGQNVQDGNAWNCVGKNKPGLSAHSLDISHGMKLFLTRKMIFLQHSFLVGAFRGTNREKQGTPNPKCNGYNIDFIQQMGLSEEEVNEYCMPEAITFQTGQSYLHVDSLNCPTKTRDHVVIFTLYVDDLKKWLQPKDIEKLEKMKVNCENTYINLIMYTRKHIQRAIEKRKNQGLLSDYGQEMIATISDYQKEEDVIDCTEFHQPGMQEKFEARKLEAQTNTDYPDGYIIVQKEGVCRNWFLGSIAAHFLRWCQVYEDHLMWGHIDEFLALASRYVNGSSLINGVLAKLSRRRDNECVAALKKCKTGQLFLFMEKKLMWHGDREKDPKEHVGSKKPRWQVGGERLFCCYPRNGAQMCSKYVSFVSDILARLRADPDKNVTKEVHESDMELVRSLLCDKKKRKEEQVDFGYIKLGPVRGNLTVQLAAFILAVPPENAEWAYMARGNNGYYQSVKYWLTDDSEKRVTIETLRERAEHERLMICQHYETFTKAQQDQVNCRWARDNLSEEGKRNLFGNDIIFLNKRRELATPPMRTKSRKGKMGHCIQLLLGRTWTNLDDYVQYKNIGCKAYTTKWKCNPKMEKVTRALLS